MTTQTAIWATKAKPSAERNQDDTPESPVPSKLWEGFDAKLQHAHRQADDLLAKMNLRQA